MESEDGIGVHGVRDIARIPAGCLMHVGKGCLLHMLCDGPICDPRKLRLAHRLRMTITPSGDGPLVGAQAGETNFGSFSIAR